MLLWSCNLWWMNNIARLAILAAIEHAFNVFPATEYSSLALMCAHGALLLALFTSPPRAAPSASEPTKKRV